MTEPEGSADAVTGPVLQVHQLSRTYPGPPPVHALREASFEVPSGDLVTIQGPSGSGKSTLLQVLGLLDQPTSGSYQLAGRDTAHLSESERCWLRASAIGFVFQAFQLLEAKSAAQNVELGLLYRGVPSRQAATRAADALARVGLGSHQTQQVGLMSGGERQRVAIARALVGDPAVLLCDEPTGNLDSANGESVLNLFTELNSQGSTVLIITHDPAIAELGSQRLRLVDGVLS